MTGVATFTDSSASARSAATHQGVYRHGLSCEGRGTYLRGLLPRAGIVTGEDTDAQGEFTVEKVLAWAAACWRWRCR